MSNLERIRTPLHAELLTLAEEASEPARPAHAEAGGATPLPAVRRRVRRKRFAEQTPAGARAAAGRWLSDFSRHGPLQIRRIATRRCSDLFLTEVTYTRW